MPTTCTTSACGTGGYTGPAPGDPDNNAILSAVPAFGGIDVSWSFPTTNPHAVSHTQVYRGTTSVFANALLHRVVAGNSFRDWIDTETTYYYWIRIVATPSGNVGDPIGPASATALPAIGAIIDGLTGQLEEDQLSIDLKNRLSEITTLSGNLADEIIARQDAEAFLAAALEAANAGVDEALAFIGSEITTRTTADSAMASQIDLMVAAVDDAVAAIATETTARADGDSALASQITTLATTVDGHTSAITTEQTTRANADSALSSQITTLTSSVNSNAAAISSEATTRANADSALSSQITTVATSASNNAAAITAETTARTNADSALSTSITNLTSTVGTKNKTYSQTTAPASGMGTGDIWFDTDDNNRIYRYNGSAWVVAENGNIPSLVQAAINSEITTRANADTAEANARLALQSTVDGHTTAISTETSTRATQTGELYAKYTVKIDTNGYVSGFGLASTANNAAPTSSFSVRADAFYIASPSGPGVAEQMPFIVRTTPGTLNGVTVPVGVYMKDTFIQNASITNAKIVTLDVSKLTAGTIAVGQYIQSQGRTGYASGASGFYIGADGKVSFGNPTGARLQWTGSAIEIYNDNNKLTLSSGGTETKQNLVRSFIKWSHSGTNYSTNSTTAIDGSVLVIPAASNNQASSIVLDSAYAGDYVLSFRARSWSTRVLTVDITPSNANPAIAPVSTVAMTNSSWKRYTINWTVTADLTGKTLRFFAPSGADSIEIEDLKMEWGSNPTPWSPNVQDVTSVNNKVTSLNASTFIADLAVNTIQIAGNAVTAADYAGTANTYSVTGIEQEILYKSFSIPGLPAGETAAVIVIVTVNSNISGSSNLLEYKLYVDGSGTSSLTWQTWTGNPTSDTSSIKLTLGSGSHTFSLKIREYNWGSVSVNNAASLVYLSAKR